VQGTAKEQKVWLWERLCHKVEGKHTHAIGMNALKHPYDHPW
jgi:hypothetical protein